jgi:hypothetical protein
VGENSFPSNSGVGEVPACTAWDTLFKYLKAQSPKTLKSGKLDRYIEGMEKIDIHANKAPDIYGFYLSKGMPERAKKFRAWATKASSYDLEPFFKEVDQDFKRGK